MPASQELRRVEYGIAVALAIVCYGSRAYQPNIKICAADGRRRWAPPLSAVVSMAGRWTDQVLRRMGVARQKDGRLLETRGLRVGKQSSECRPVGLGPGRDSCVPMSHQAMAPLCTGSQVTVSMRTGHRATVTSAPDQSSPIRPLCPCAHQYGPIWTATTGSVVSTGVAQGVGGYEQERRCTGDPGARENIRGGVCQGADRA